MLVADPTPLRRPRRAAQFGAVAMVTAVVVAAGLIITARRAVDGIERVDAVAGVLSRAGGAVENFLLVGSDSREAGDPNTGDSADASSVGGRRSDSIILLRRDRATGEAALLSIPRDLYVEIPGRPGMHRINAAFGDGPDILVRTVQESLGIPVHHYVEVDFTGFTALVDAVGGVEVCFEHPARDANTGLDIRVAGCQALDGRQALAYTRSRYYEEFVDGEWRRDPTSDIGRSTRQRAFIDATLARAFDAVLGNPLGSGAVVEAVLSTVRVDPGFDPVAVAGRLRPAAAGGLATVSLPVTPVTVDGDAVLLLDPAADAVLAWCRGEGTVPIDATSAILGDHADRAPQ
ncbi:MAG: LCP family protein [Ilumatobacteraceae bacterium]